MTWVGNSGQIVDYFAGQPDHDLIILSGHGDERGLLLPKLDNEIAARYPCNDVIRPEDFDQFLRLGGNTVISLACLGGRQQLADVFLANGARYYIATTYPLRPLLNNNLLKYRDQAQLICQLRRGNVLRLMAVKGYELRPHHIPGPGCNNQLGQALVPVLSSGK